MLRLKVEVDVDGHMEARGILSENVRVLYENGQPMNEDCLCNNGLAHLRSYGRISARGAVWGCVPAAPLLGFYSVAKELSQCASYQQSAKIK